MFWQISWKAAVKVCIWTKQPIRQGFITVSVAWSDLEYFHSPPPTPLDGMLVHHRVTPSIKFVGTHLQPWPERSTVRVKCLAQEHNVTSSSRDGCRDRKLCQRTISKCNKHLIIYMKEHGYQQQRTDAFSDFFFPGMAEIQAKKSLILTI